MSKGRNQGAAAKAMQPTSHISPPSFLGLVRAVLPVGTSWESPTKSSTTRDVTRRPPLSPTIHAPSSSPRPLLLMTFLLPLPLARATLNPYGACHAKLHTIHHQRMRSAQSIRPRTSLIHAAFQRPSCLAYSNRSNKFAPAGHRRIRFLYCLISALASDATCISQTNQYQCYYDDHQRPHLLLLSDTL